MTITAGERVTFAYPTGSNFHNVAFDGSPAPASCPHTKASPGGSLDTDDAPPMPGAFGNGWGPGWEGYCTFPNVGTYTLICQVHAGHARHGDRRAGRDADADADRDADADAASGAGDDDHERSDRP